MAVAVLDRPTPPSGGPAGAVAARRAVVRWAWRLFRREWRQQALVLLLIVVAVGATVVASAVATDTPPSANSGFGTAQDAATFPGTYPRLSSQIAAIEHRFGKVDVIENETESIPGSIISYDLRSQNPDGPFGQPMLGLVSGRFPANPSEVAVTSSLASDFSLRVGATWHQGGTARLVVGIVENPQSLLDSFALVVPGQVKAPTQVTVLFDAPLFDAPGLKTSAIGPNVSTPASVAQHNPLNPETISLAVLTIGMLLIALVAIGGFTVLAQRRLRSLGMLAALGATDRHVRLVVRANGVLVGVIGALIGGALGLVAWLLYRPHLEMSVHHVIGLFALPWLVVGLALLLAIGATYFASSRPARSITKLPIVVALSGRPAPPAQIHRSAVPGLVCFFVAFLLIGYAGGSGGGVGNGGMPELALGLVALIPAVILLAPFCLSLLARIGRHSPVAVRLALRDLARYRARSGSALAAISLGVMIAVIIATAAAARYGNAWDYAGPNVSSNQLVLYTPGGGPEPGPGAVPSAKQMASMSKVADTIGVALGARSVVELDATDASLDHRGGGRQFNGTIYVATPQLLRAFGIPASAINPKADILTMRAGLASAAGVSLSWCNRLSKASGKVGPGGSQQPQQIFTCVSNGSLSNPVIQQINALPSGTSAPNVVITEHAVQALHVGSITTSGWLIQTNQALTAVQIHDAEAAAAAAGMTIETENHQPTSSQVINSATAFGLALALCVLAMSVGLIRSETAGDLRTLAATGASSNTRRTLTAVTAGGLGFVGAVLGTVAGYVAIAAWLRGNSLNGGISSLSNVPLRSLLTILVAMPLIAGVAGWLLAGRQPEAMARQPIE